MNEKQKRKDEKVTSGKRVAISARASGGPYLAAADPYKLFNELNWGSARCCVGVQVCLYCAGVSAHSKMRTFGRIAKPHCDWRVALDKLATIASPYCTTTYHYDNVFALYLYRENKNAIPPMTYESHFVNIATLHFLR